ncbi:MAG: hypothetical protein Crog4KO_05610 [Crocinitomicaceae bacterium]
MNLVFYLLVTCLLALSCQDVNTDILAKTHEVIPPESLLKDSTLVDTASLQINLVPSGDYVSLKAEIKKKKASQYSKADFEHYLLDQIIPHWYGTEWDFNGYSATPNEGVIACGYFVSTTLEHIGLVINRYHLAQQAGLNEAKSLAIEESKYFTVYGWEALKKKMNDYEDGIYFVGLDNHVGYLYKEAGILYFIHSNYIEDRVMIEKAQFSQAFESNIYVVAELSTNELLREKWRKGQRVEVIR